MISEYKLTLVHRGRLHYAKVRLSLKSTHSDSISVAECVVRNPSSHEHVSEEWIVAAVEGAKMTLQAMKQRGDISGGWVAVVEDVSGLFSDTDAADACVAAGQAAWLAAMPGMPPLETRFDNHITLSIWDDLPDHHEKVGRTEK